MLHPIAAFRSPLAIPSPSPSAVLAAWLLAERIVAVGQLVWGGVLRGSLPPPARRPLDVAFWAAFAAAVLWPLW